MKVEMHSHTYFSPDGFITPKTLTARCSKKRIDCVCITDHNSLQGAIEFSRQTSVKIIKGEEIATGEGEVIGLFIREEIPPNLGLKVTVEKIKSQGGIVYLPHPFDEFRKSAVKFKSAQDLKNSFDIVEIFNSRTLNPKYNTLALDFARENNIAVAVGSDAHHPLELGNSYMKMDNFTGPESFLKNLRSATYVTRSCPLALRFYIKGLKIITGKS